jgi:hypothetical protein
MVGIYAVRPLSARHSTPRLVRVTTPTTGVPMTTARLMWTLFEPVHMISYYHPRALAAFEAIGLRGVWRGYFAGRVSPLGPMEAPPVIAAFLVFAPQMVTRALPAIWELASPEQARQARLAGAVEALAELTYDQPQAPVAEAADLLQEAVEALDHSGRVLGAANAALPVPSQPLARLWQAATTLREHRGDGHVAAIITAGLDGCETLVFRSSLDLPREVVQPVRGWAEEPWRAATDRLIERGWLDGEGRPTRYGVETFTAIERHTDEGAAAPWRALGPDRTQRLRELLTPIARACFDSVPKPNLIGLPAPA